MSDPLILVYNADDNFAMGLAVSIRSAMEHLPPKQPVMAHIIDGGFSPQVKERVISSLQFSNLKLAWVTPTEEHFLSFAEMPEIPKKWPLVVNYRLLMADLLPTCSRALYLDADTIILDDLRPLWNEDMAGNLVGMVPMRDRVSDTISVYRELGLDGNRAYYNSGVVLADLQGLRSGGFVKKLLDFMIQYQESIRFPDQDALNVVLDGKLKPLDQRWNSMLKGGRAQLRRAVSKLGIGANPLEEVGILHYTERKPWELGCAHAYREEFFHVLDRTAWRGWRPPASDDRRERVKFVQFKVKQAVRRRWNGAAKRFASAKA